MPEHRGQFTHGAEHAPVLHLAALPTFLRHGSQGLRLAALGFALG
jgi:hypothetical protein